MNDIIISILTQMKLQLGIKIDKRIITAFCLTLNFFIHHKINFSQLARYSGRNEESYRNLFAKPFDFFNFNKILIEQHIEGKKAIAFDPSYINKTGKHTAGVNYFWSGVAGQMKWGLELGDWQY